MPEAARQQEAEPTPEELEQQEREAFEQAVAEDPELADEPASEPSLEAVKSDVERRRKDEGDEDEQQQDGEPTEKGARQDQVEEEQIPTGLEWLGSLSEEEAGAAKSLLTRQAETIARYEQRIASHLGQLRPAQRIIAKLQRQLAQVQQSPRAMPEKFKTAVDNAIKSIEKDYEDYPEEASKLKALVTELSDGFTQSLESVQQQSPQQQPPTPGQPQQPRPAPHLPDRNNEFAHLSAAYSDWAERRYSPAFDEWIRQQQPDVVQLLNSPYASDNVALLDAFSADNPDWQAPQTPDEFVSYPQAQHNPMFRGWAETVGFDANVPASMLTPNQQGLIIAQFKRDLGEAWRQEREGDPDGGDDGQQQGGQPVTERIAARRAAQLRDRDPGSRRSGIRAGDRIDLDTDEGQRALFNQMVDADPDIP